MTPAVPDPPPPGARSPGRKPPGRYGKGTPRPKRSKEALLSASFPDRLPFERLDDVRVVRKPAARRGRELSWRQLMHWLHGDPHRSDAVRVCPLVLGFVEGIAELVDARLHQSTKSLCRAYYDSHDGRTRARAGLLQRWLERLVLTALRGTRPDTAALLAALPTAAWTPERIGLLPGESRIGPLPVEPVDSAAALAALPEASRRLIYLLTAVRQVERAESFPARGRAVAVVLRKLRPFRRFQRAYPETLEFLRSIARPPDLPGCRPHPLLTSARGVPDAYET